MFVTPFPTEQLGQPVEYAPSRSDVSELQPLDMSIADSEGTSEGAIEVRQVVTDLFDGEMPDVVFAHSGGMSLRPNGKYRTTSYAEDQLTEHGQATGGRLRIIATAAIAETIPEVPIVTNSFMDGHPEAPTMAQVAKDELVQRGVDPDRIHKEEESFTTITQHREMVKLAVANGWQRIVVVVNEFHVQRVQGFLDRLDTLTEEGVDDTAFQQTLAEFKERGVQVEILAAETVLTPLSSHFANYFGRVALSPQYQFTVSKEAEGLAALEAGKYRTRLTPSNPPQRTSGQ